MGTTNILDLNNRLTKVEKEKVAQNSYTSLKNKPKINGVTLTGNKSLADIGAAAAADVDKINLGDFRFYPVITNDNYAAISLPKANNYTINLITFLGTDTPIPEAVDGITDGYKISVKNPSGGYLSLSLVGSYANNAGRALRVLVNIQ